MFRFILKEGRLFLNADHLKMIWTSLAEHAIYPEDREQCFRWFAEVNITIIDNIIGECSLLDNRSSRFRSKNNERFLSTSNHETRTTSSH